MGLSRPHENNSKRLFYEGGKRERKATSTEKVGRTTKRWMMVGIERLNSRQMRRRCGGASRASRHFLWYGSYLSHSTPQHFLYFCLLFTLWADRLDRILLLLLFFITKEKAFFLVSLLQLPNWWNCRTLRTVASSGRSSWLWCLCTRPQCFQCPSSPCSWLVPVSPVKKVKFLALQYFCNSNATLDRGQNNYLGLFHVKVNKNFTNNKWNGDRLVIYHE